MQNIKWALQSFAISFEFLIIVVAILFHFYCPQGEEMLDVFLSHKEAKFISFIPAGIFIYILKYANGIYSPSHEKRHILLKWPERPRLIICGTVGLLYGLVAAVTSILAYILVERISTQIASLVILSSILVSITTAGSLYFAQHALNAALDSVE